MFNKKQATQVMKARGAAQTFQLGKLRSLTAKDPEAALLIAEEKAFNGLVGAAVLVKVSEGSAEEGNLQEGYEVEDLFEVEEVAPVFYAQVDRHAERLRRAMEARSK